MAEKNCFDMTKLLFQIMCVTVVQWSRNCFECADKPGSTPGDAVFCFFVQFFFLFGLFFFNTIFPSLFLLLTLLVMHLDQYKF